MPEMFFASLSASALLAYGKDQEKIYGQENFGLHGTQSYHARRSGMFGPVQVYVREGRVPGRGGVETFELGWKQGKESIARGSSSVIPLDVK